MCDKEDEVRWSLFDSLHKTLKILVVKPVDSIQLTILIAKFKTELSDSADYCYIYINVNESLYFNIPN